MVNSRRVGPTVTLYLKGVLDELKSAGTLGESEGDSLDEAS